MFKSRLFLMLISLFVSMYVPTIVYANNETAGQYVKSSTITADIKTKFLADSDIKSLHITVDTVKDKVTLKGYVDTDAQKVKAGQIASEVTGVKEVKNRLVVHH